MTEWGIHPKGAASLMVVIILTIVAFIATPLVVAVFVLIGPVIVPARLSVLIFVHLMFSLLPVCSYSPQYSAVVLLSGGEEVP